MEVSGPVDTMAVVAACREAATIKEFLVLATELLREDRDGPVHILPKKSFFVFTLVSRRIWFAQTRGGDEVRSRDELVTLWALLTQLLGSFGAGELDAVKDDLIRLVFDEYEKGTAASREAAWRFVSAIDSSDKLRQAFRVDYDVAVGGRKSPSFSDALRACQDGRLWAPLLRLIEESAQSKLDKGMSTYDRLFFKTDESSNLYPLLACGPVAYGLIVQAMFPVMSKESTRKASRKTASSIDLGMALLQNAHARVPQLTAPLFARIVEACAANYSSEEVIQLVGKFQAWLGSADSPWMASLVRATRGIRDQEWCRGWAWKLVEAAMAERASLSDTALKSIAAVLEVTPTVAFKAVDAGLLHRAVESGQGQVEVLAGLMQAHATLRAVPDFFMYLLSLSSEQQQRMTIREAYIHPQMRAAARTALLGCLPSVAAALALVPRDVVSAAMVCDILRWGPIGPEAKASGWDALQWAEQLCGWAVTRKSPAVLRCCMDALHYRWDPLLLEAAKQRGFFGLADGALLEPLQRVRLARDFPRYWARPADAAAICEPALCSEDVADWSLLLWAGGAATLRAWLSRAPLASFLGAEASEGWRRSSETAHETVEAMLASDTARAHAIALAAPLEVLAEYRGQDLGRVVDAFVAAGAAERLAELLHAWPALRGPTESRWLQRGTPLGAPVAEALASRAVWKAALRLPRPQLWPYVAACGSVKRSLKRLLAAGPAAWGREAGCWDAWLSVLRAVDAATWARRIGGELAATLLALAWREREWRVLVALHEALVRMGCEGAGVAMRKSLMIVLSGKIVVEDAVVAKLLALADYGMSLAAARADRSGRVLALLLGLPSELHDRSALREVSPAFLAQLRNCGDRLRAAQCAERLIRLVPPYDATQLALYLQLCLLGERSSAAQVRAAMAALDTARRVCPSVWFRGAGLVAAFEARALALVAKFGDEEWVRAARAVGRAIGGGGADLKQRKYYLAFAQGDWLSHGEPRASLAVRTAMWQEGMVAAMESAVSEADQAFSFHMVTGANSNKASWKRYKRKYDEQDKYTGKL